MKKIYLFLALFLAMLGGGSNQLKAEEIKTGMTLSSISKAPIGDLASLADGSKVVLRNVGYTSCIYEDASNNKVMMGYVNTPTLGAGVNQLHEKDLASMQYVWTISKKIDGTATTYSFQGNSGKYMPKSNGDATLGNIQDFFKITNHPKNPTTSPFLIEGNDNNYFDGRDAGKPFAFWSDKSTANTQYEIYTVTEVETTIYTYTVTINAVDSKGNSIGTETVKRVSGAKLGAFTFPFYTVGKMTESSTATELTSNSVVEKDMTITATCIDNPPFKTTTISNGEFANETHWYQLKMHPGNPHFCNYVSGQTQTNMTSKTGEKSDDYLWCFVGDVYNGFKIYNRQAGTAMPLSALGTEDDHKKLAYCTTNTDDATSMWSICESNNTNGPCFKLKVATNQYLNYQGDVLKYWTENDNGSTFMFVDVTTTSLTDAKSLFLSSGCVGGYSDADLSSLQPVVATYENSKTEANFTALREACLGMNSKSVIPMKAGYYRVYGTRANNPGYLTYNTTANKIQGGHANLEAPYSQQIWKFEEAETGKYKISSGTTYIGAGNTPSDPADATAAGVYELVSKGIGGQALKTTNNRYLHSGGSWVGSYNIVYYGPGAAAPDGSIWYIKETTLLDVAISTAAKGYATVSSTFPLMIPTGVKAYYANKKGAASLNLTEVTGEVIPANEGVVLYSDDAKTTATTYTFVGALTAGTPFASANLLSNTAAGSKAVGTQSTCYVLACPAATKVVGFYKAATSLVIPANKAYYQSNGGASLFSIIGGDEELTEIGGVVTDGETVTNGKAYNLNGTPASQLTKGGIYIINGKKVMK